MIICNKQISEKVMATLSLVLLDCGVKFHTKQSFYNIIARLCDYLGIPEDATSIEITDEAKTKIIQFCTNSNEIEIPDGMYPMLYPGEQGEIAGGLYFDKNRDWIELGSSETYDIPAIFRAHEIVNGSYGSIYVTVALQNKKTGDETYKTISITSTATWKGISYCTVQLKAASSHIYAYVSYYMEDGTLIGTLNASASNAAYGTYYYKFCRINASPAYDVLWTVEPTEPVNLSEWLSVDASDFKQANASTLHIGDIYSASSVVFANRTHYSELIPVNTHVLNKYLNDRPIKYTEVYDVAIRNDIHASLVYILLSANARINTKRDMDNLVYRLYMLTRDTLQISDDRHIVINEGMQTALQSIKELQSVLFTQVTPNLEDGWYPVRDIRIGEDYLSNPFSLEDTFREYADRLEESLDYPYRFYLPEEVSSYEASVVLERQSKADGTISIATQNKSGSNTSKKVAYCTVKRVGNDVHSTFIAQILRYDSRDVLQGTYDVGIVASELKKYLYKLKFPLLNSNKDLTIKEYREFDFTISTECVAEMTTLNLGDRYRASSVRDGEPITLESLTERYINGSSATGIVTKVTFNTVILDTATKRNKHSSKRLIVKTIKSKATTSIKLATNVKMLFNTRKVINNNKKLTFTTKASIVRTAKQTNNVSITDNVVFKNLFKTSSKILMRYKTPHNVKLDTVKSVKQGSRTVIEVTRPVKATARTSVKVIQGYKKVFKTITSIKKDVRTAHDTKIQTAIRIKNVSNVEASIINKYTQKHDTKANVVKSVKTRTNSVTIVSKNIKVIFDVVRAVIKRYNHTGNVTAKVTTDVKRKFNTSVETANIQKVKYSTSVKIESITKRKHNAGIVITKAVATSGTTNVEIQKVIKSNHDTRVTKLARKQSEFNVRVMDTKSCKTSHATTISDVKSVKHRFNSRVTLDGVKIKQYSNTNLTITKDVSKRFAVAGEIANTIKHEHQALSTITKDSKQSHDVTAKVVMQWYVKKRFDASLESNMRARMLFNTLMETSILEVIKQLLDITDKSKDSILRWYISKAKEDIALFTNIPIEELEDNSQTNSSRQREPKPQKQPTIPHSTMQFIVVDLVIYYYRMRGQEHLNSESMSGASWNYITEIPQTIQARLKPYKRMRKLRVL